MFFGQISPNIKKYYFRKIKGIDFLKLTIDQSLNYVQKYCLNYYYSVKFIFCTK